MIDTLELVPLNDLQPSGDAWVATGDDPRFLLRPRSGRQPRGWSLLRFKMGSEAVRLSPVLYIDNGIGFSEIGARCLPVYEAAGRGVLLRLPNNVHALRLDPFSGRGKFHVEGVWIEQVGRAHAMLLRMAPVVSRLIRDPSMTRRYVATAVRIARQSGLRGLLRHALRDRRPFNGNYTDWIRAYDTLKADDHAAIVTRIAAMGTTPTISIVVPLYNTPENLLRCCIESVRSQLWPHWELCLADNASSAPHMQAICEKYTRLDKRIRYTRGEKNRDIAAASNDALSLASGEFVALLDHDDELAVHALYMVAEALVEYPDLDLIFSDEDKIDEEGKRHEPWFKSDWNYDLMLSQNAVAHLAVFRRRLIEEVGGFRSGFDDSQNYDLTLRVVERTTPDRIRHIPFVLYHWRVITGSIALSVSEKEYPNKAAARAIEEHLDRVGRTGARVECQAHPNYYRIHWPLPPDPPRVAIILPTRDKVELLRISVGTILERTDYPAAEIIIVDNGSVEKQTLRYLQEVQKTRGVRVVHYEQAYSFAALNNWAVAQTDAPLVCFLNNDVEVITHGWLSEMAAHALRSEVGAVGCKLYYPNGTVQHAGIIVGIGGVAGHSHLGFPHGALGYFGRAICAQRLSAVTAACMMMRREIFLRIGGFNERDFAIAFNDVDLGLRLNRAGLAVIWTPHAELFHHESASLGPPTSDSRRQQFEKECANLARCWPKAIKNDPFYNPNLTITRNDLSIAFPPRVVRPWQRLGLASPT